MYFGSNISSTESNVNIHISKTWIPIDRLSTIWEYDLMKQEFFQIVAMSILLYDCTTWITEMFGEKARQKLYRMLLVFWTNPGSCTSQNSSCTTTYFPLHKINKTSWGRRDKLVSDILLYLVITPVLYRD